MERTRNPKKETPNNGRSIRKLLRRADSRTQLSNRSRQEAFRRGHAKETARVGRDFGRNLSYYDQIHLALLGLGGPLGGKRFLHLAASTGIYNRFLQDEGMLPVSFDLNSDSVEIAAKIGNRFVVQGNARLSKRSKVWPKILPFQDASFEFVLSDHFLFSNYRPLEGRSERRYPVSTQVLSDIHRILKPNGIVFLNQVIPQWVTPKLLEKIGFEVIQNKRVSFEHNRQKLYGVRLIVLRKKSPVTVSKKKKGH